MIQATAWEHQDQQEHRYQHFFSAVSTEVKDTTETPGTPATVSVSRFQEKEKGGK